MMNRGGGPVESKAGAWYERPVLEAAYRELKRGNVDLWLLVGIVVSAMALAAAAATEKAR